MNGFNRLPGFEPSAPGLEWVLWRRLAAILGWGSALLAGVALALWLAASTHPTAAEDGALLLAMYRLIGLLVLHWTLVLTLAIGCVIVIVMKGPAYVADGYPPPQRDSIDETAEGHPTEWP